MSLIKNIAIELVAKLCSCDKSEGALVSIQLDLEDKKHYIKIACPVCNTSIKQPLAGSPVIVEEPK